MTDDTSESCDRSAGLRCTHCGREVNETTHTRDSWSVDYYVLHGGEVEPATISRDDERGPITYLKLVSRREVVTCVDCYRDPLVREQREDRFHSERRMDDLSP